MIHAGSPALAPCGRVLHRYKTCTPREYPYPLIVQINYLASMGIQEEKSASSTSPNQESQEPAPEGPEEKVEEDTASAAVVHAEPEGTSAEIALEKAFAAGKLAANGSAQPDGDTSVDADAERAFSLGQTSGGIERAFSLGKTVGATATPKGDSSVDADIQRAFLRGQTFCDVERAFSLGQTVGATATPKGDSSVDADVERAFSLGQISYAFVQGQALAGIERAFMQGQAFARRKQICIAPASVQPDAHIERAFSLGGTFGAANKSDSDADIERAFSRGQASAGIERAFTQGQAFARRKQICIAPASAQPDANIERAFSLGGTFGAANKSDSDADIERAFSRGQTAGATATPDCATSVDANVQRAFSLGQTAGAQAEALSSTIAVAFGAGFAVGYQSPSGGSVPPSIEAAFEKGQFLSLIMSQT